MIFQKQSSIFKLSSYFFPLYDVDATNAKLHHLIKWKTTPFNTNLHPDGHGFQQMITL